MRACKVVACAALSFPLARSFVSVGQLGSQWTRRARAPVSGVSEAVGPDARALVLRRPASAAGELTMGFRRKAVAAAALAPAMANPVACRVAVGAAAVAAVAGAAVKLVQVLDTPSRPYDRESNTVGREYDMWTEDGILEAYWGEHIHLGYYTEEERKAGYLRKDIIQAKYDFIDRMMEFGHVTASTVAAPKTVLDVGCGIGGTSRYLAKQLGSGAQVTGITLSQAQVKRGTELAKEQGLPNAKFQVMDALNMGFPDNSFDLVWACESGEHMPDKKRYIEEMVRVLKPGGRFVMATWCQRDDTEKPFSPEELRRLDLLYSEWTHPHFISILAYDKLLQGTGAMEQIETADWSKETIDSWLHIIVAGILKPWPFVRRPLRWWRTVRDAWCIERMREAFTPKLGLMQYGMFTAVKKAEAPAATP